MNIYAGAHRLIARASIGVPACPHMPGTAGRPSPQAAHAEWVAACAVAGWHAGQLAEQVSVHDALGRVSAAAARAHWAAPRFDCAAMGGIAIAAGAAGGGLA